MIKIRSGLKYIVLALIIMFLIGLASAKSNLNLNIVDDWFNNTDFEDGLTLWDVTVLSGYGNVSSSTDQAASGIKSMNITTSGNVVVGQLTGLSNFYISNQSEYKLSAKFKGNVTGNSVLRLYTAGQTLQSSYVAAGNYTGWTYLNWTVPVTYNNNASFRWGVQVTNNNNVSLYIDDVVLTVSKQQLRYVNGSADTTFKINIPDNYNESSPHPLYVQLHGSGGSSTYASTFNNKYVAVAYNDSNSKNNSDSNDTYWYGNNSDNYTEKMVVNLTASIIKNNSVSINSSQVYGYGSSMGGAILRIALKNPALFKGVQLNVPLFNYSDTSWYTGREASMDWVFGTPNPNANYNNSNPIYLLQNGYSPNIPVRLIYGDSDTTVHPENNSILLKNLYYQNSGYLELTSVYNGGHSIFDNDSYIEDFFDLLRTNNNDLSSIPYIEVLNASADVKRGNVTKNSFDLLTTTAANLEIVPKNFNGNVYLNNLTTITTTTATLNYSILSNTLTTFNIVNATILPSLNTVIVNVTTWNTAGDYRKAFNLTASASVTAGDFAPNTNYWIYKNGVKWTILKSNSTGYISFSDTITSETQYSTTSTTVQDAYKTSTCQSTLNWGVVGSALIIVLILISAGGMALGFMTGTLKFDTFPIQEFVLTIVAVVVIGSIGVAIINPIIIVVGCP